jgi:hypothetical protein
MHKTTNWTFKQAIHHRKAPGDIIWSPSCKQQRRKFNWIQIQSTYHHFCTWALFEFPVNFRSLAKILFWMAGWVLIGGNICFSVTARPQSFWSQQEFRDNESSAKINCEIPDFGVDFGEVSFWELEGGSSTLSWRELSSRHKDTIGSRIPVHSINGLLISTVLSMFTRIKASDPFCSGAMLKVSAKCGVHIESNQSYLFRLLLPACSGYLRQIK